MLIYGLGVLPLTSSSSKTCNVQYLTSLLDTNDYRVQEKEKGKYGDTPQQCSKEVSSLTKLLHSNVGPGY